MPVHVFLNNLLGNSDGPRPEWFRTHHTVEQDAVSPVETTAHSYDPQQHDIDPVYILPDGSVTEVTEYTDLMCKHGKETEYYVVSKCFPDRGYSLVQNFRKVHDTDLGIDTYVRGECIEYKTMDKTPFPDQIKKDDTLEEVLASFHIQKNLAARVMLLSKPLKKGKSEDQKDELEEVLNYRR